MIFLSFLLFKVSNATNFFFLHRSPEEILPRYSSENFNEDEIGEPILEVTLEAGDLLYFPRGFIHQAKCSSVAHSLHITVSCYQKNSWADLFEKVTKLQIFQQNLHKIRFANLISR